jgi:hypothetical protein
MRRNGRNLIASLLLACAVILAVAAEVGKDSQMMAPSMRVYAAGLASPSPTPAVDQFFIAWKMTARGHSKAPIPDPGGFGFEATRSSASEGQAVVTFDAGGHRLEGRILKAYLSDELDTKMLPLSVKNVCGPLSMWEHDHYSLKTLEPMSGPDGLWMQQAPRKQADGSWVIPSIFSGAWWSGYVASHHFATLHFSQSWRDRYHYEGGNVQLADVVTSGPIHTVCDDPRRPSDLKMERAKVFVPQGTITPIEPIGGLDRDLTEGRYFSVPSAGPIWLAGGPPSPDLFFKEWKFLVMESECSGPGACGSVPVEVDWTITVRRLGKCRVSGEIPLNDDPVNPDIYDEDIEMGVEHGSDSIDPDDGVAALNIRVTCDAVPIKNAKVDVKVEVQKNTGGHTHDAAGRPRGSFDGKTLTDAKPSIQKTTDDDGRIHLTFKPGKANNHADLGIAGIYRITATSVRAPGRTAEVAVEAKVDGLSNLSADSNYVNDVRVDGHTTGDNATAATKQRLLQFASDFQDAQVKHNKQLAACGAAQWLIYPLWVIDVSLPFGGLYDLDKDWSTPHQTHQGGYGVDFSDNSAEKRCKTCTTAWPNGNFTVPVCDAYKVAPQGWLLTTMDGLGRKYGTWDKSDLCDDKPRCMTPRWHLHFKQ